MTLLVVIITVSAIILALILTLWIKTRIHEIGVFLSVGIKKSAVIGQYLIEVLMIAVLAFGLSYFSSNAIAGQIGNHLLEQSMQVESEDDEMFAAATAVEVGADNLVQEPLPTENGIQVSVGLDNLLQLFPEKRPIFFRKSLTCHSRTTRFPIRCSEDSGRPTASYKRSHP